MGSMELNLAGSGVLDLDLRGSESCDPDPNDIRNLVSHDGIKVPATVTSKNFVKSTPANGTTGNASIYGFDPLLLSARPSSDIFGAPMKFKSADEGKEVAVKRCAGIQELLAIHNAGDGLRSLILDSRFVRKGHFPLSRYGWLFLPLFRADLDYAAPDIAISDPRRCIAPVLGIPNSWVCSQMVRCGGSRLDVGAPATPLIKLTDGFGLPTSSVGVCLDPFGSVMAMPTETSGDPMSMLMPMPSYADAITPESFWGRPLPLSRVGLRL